MTSCCGVILAGGLSSRMGSDKAKLLRHNQTMLEYSTKLLESLGLDVLVSGGEQGIADCYPNKGPLGGIFSVIKHCEDERLSVDAMLILPVDMPLLTEDVLNHLLSIGEKSSLACYYEDCFLPLYLPINRELRNYLQNVFSETAGQTKTLQHSPVKNKASSIKKMLTAINAQTVPVENTRVLSNANTPEEWAQVSKWI